MLIVAVLFHVSLIIINHNYHYNNIIHKTANVDEMSNQRRGDLVMLYYYILFVIILSILLLF